MPQIQEVAPKYLQIANHLKSEIVRGDRRPGEELPSERQIAITWKVARPTAAKAVQVLRQQGLVESRQGAGTFVCDPQAAARAVERYERARKLGRIYVPGDYAKIKVAEIVPAPDYVATALNISPGSDVVRRHRVTISKVHGPVETSVSWLDAGLLNQASLLVQPERILRGTVGYVEDTTGRVASYARDQMAARLATDEERTDLGLADECAAVLVYRHTVYDSRDTPIEFVEAVYPPDRWTFEQEYAVSS